MIKGASLMFSVLGIGLFISPAFLSLNLDAFKPRAIAQTPASPVPSPSPSVAAPLANPTTPDRLTISVSVADPDDLKVKEGQDIQRGDLVADRGRERARLEAQQQQLNLTLSRLKSSTVTKPLPPAVTPSIAQLPSPSYLEEQAAIDRAKATVAQIEQTIGLKRQEVQYLRGLENLDPLVLDHEAANLAELQQQQTIAVRDYQLAVGRLATAKEARARDEYQRSVSLSQRADAHNRDALEYQQQLAQYEQRLRDRDFQLSQTQLQLDEIQNAIATLAVVKSPYRGRVRRIRAIGQGPDGSLAFEITLLVNDSGDGDGGSATLPEQQPRMRDAAQRTGDRPQ